MVGAQLYRLSAVDKHTVSLQPIQKITRHYSRYCAVVFCYVRKCELSYIYPGHDVNLHLHSAQSEILSNRVCRIWLGIGEGANVIISKQVIRLDSWLLRSCNWSVILWIVLHCYRVTWGIMHFITLAILSGQGRFAAPTVGTNWPFCADVPLNTNQSVGS